MATWIHGVLEWLAAITGSYGWAILLLTVGVRLAVTPLQLWQRRAQAGIAAGQASAGKLLAGCLPTLAQWPLLLAVYGAVSSFSFVVPAGFFWLEHLGSPDPYLVLPLLVVLTSGWQAWVTVPKEQRVIMLALPVLMGLVVVKASAAVALYCLANNVVGLVQHYLTAPRRAAVA